MPIRCGNCKDVHDTVTQVKRCYDVREEPAKEGSISYAQKLYREHDASNTCLGHLSREEAEEMINSATKSGIARLIDELQLAPMRKVDRGLEAGYYKSKGGTGSIWKAYKGQNGHLLAKELRVYEEDGSHEWVYRGAATRLLGTAVRLSLEDAKAFGAIYGFCCVCGRTLTNEVSIAEGIGPICAGRL